VSQLGTDSIGGMSGGKAWAVYILLRLGFFLVPFAVLVWLGTMMWFPIWLAAIFAALIGLSLSVLVLNKPRAEASETIYEWRERRRNADDIAEDDIVDANLTAGKTGEAEQNR
jgi:pilus assembly protein TadC